MTGQDNDNATAPPLQQPAWMTNPGREVSFDGTTYSLEYLRPGEEKMTFVSASETEINKTAATIAAFDAALADENLVTASVESLYDELAATVEDLVRTVQGHDSLDIMAMIYQLIAPPHMALWRETESTLEHSYAAAEVVTLVLLGLGLPSADAPSRPTADIIPELMQKAAEILHITQAEALNRAIARMAEDDDAASRSHLAWRLASHENVVRGRHYESVAEAINRAILESDRAVATWTEVLGYSYTDLAAVRDALADICTDQTARVMETIHTAANTERPEDADDESKEAFRTFFQNPSKMRLVTVEEVSQRSRVDFDRTTAILNDFSVGPLDDGGPVPLLEDFTKGASALKGKAILHAPGCGYLVLNGALAPDEIRRTVEPKMKRTQHWNKYSDTRASSAEVFAANLLQDFLPDTAAIQRGIKYRVPPPLAADFDLSASSACATQGNLAEADILVILDGVALCVEVKSGDLRARSRAGGPDHLHGDLTKNVGGAANQADRLRNLITLNHGLWLEDGTWMDLRDVREVHSVVVSLDDLGPAALTMQDLISSNIITQVHLPWITSLHDLVVILETLQGRPEDLLLYLRRRTHREASVRISASDELDIFMWFINGGLYFESDPDRMHASHPGSRPPTQKDRRRYEEQGRVLVGTFTDELDAWLYFKEGSSSAVAQRPLRLLEPMFERITQHLKGIEAPGWWRFAADINAFSTQRLHVLAGNLLAAHERTRADDRLHMVTISGTDDDGRGVYVFATGPNTKRVRERLQNYLSVKKHQEWADRAMVVLLNTHGIPVWSLWLSHPRVDDPYLDAQARQMRLIPPERAPRAIPPSIKKQRPQRQNRKRRKRR